MFYARDAFDGLHAMDELTQISNNNNSQRDTTHRVSSNAATMAAGASNESIQTVEDAEDLVGEDAKLGMAAARVSQSKSALDSTHTTKSAVQPAEIIPTAPFYGSKVVEITDLNKVFAFINETALFKGQWQYKQGRKTKEEYQEILENEVYPKFRDIKAKAIREKLLEAKLVYGYFPCRSEGNDLIILQDDEKTERLRFTFPRQPLEQRGSKNLCLADYFLSGSADIRMSAEHENAPENSSILKVKEQFKDSSENIGAEDQTVVAVSGDADKSVRAPVDVVAFQLVTMGRKASEYAAELFKSDNYTDYLLFHGLSVESAEALAEMWHKRIREELVLPKRCTRLAKPSRLPTCHSFGYPACPNSKIKRNYSNYCSPKESMSNYQKSSSFIPNNQLRQ